MESKNKRLHGLDAYRAILMILGVVLHTALLYELGGIIGSIHSFRMPAFYLLSGYFGALLFYKMEFLKMVKNRIKRVFFPFFVFVFLFFPINTFVWTYLDSFNRGVVNPLEYSLNFTIKGNLLPTDTMHFWFLYYLIFVIFIVLIVVLCFERFSYSFPNLKMRLKGIFEGQWSFMFLIGALNFFWSVLFSWAGIPTDTSWVPNFIIILYYTLFYSLGWLIYTSKVDLSLFKKNAWYILVLGLFCSLFHGSFDHLFTDYDDKKGILLQWDKVFWFLVKNMVLSMALVCWVRGLLGIFLKYCSSGSKVWRYISDSSYWIFIVHITICPLTFILLANWTAPIFLKFLISALLVFFVCLISYDGFIRSTFVGAFLNGRIYPSFNKLISLILCFLIGGGTFYLFQNPLDVLKRPSPWAYGKKPTELLIKKKVVYPYVKKNISLSGASLLRCAKVDDYVICPDGLNFKDAKKACGSLGGKMATFDKLETYQRVMEWLPSLLKRRVWLAITDSKSEGTWLWPNGEVLDFEFWISNEPNNWGKGEDCAEIQLWKKRPGWNDLACDAKLAFICDLKDSPK